MRATAAAIVAAGVTTALGCAAQEATALHRGSAEPIAHSVLSEVASAPVVPRPPPPSVATSDPWAGPMSWTRTEMTCEPVRADNAAWPSPAWSARTIATRDDLGVIAISSSDPNDVWFGSKGVVIHTRDHGKTFERCGLGTTDVVESMWAASASEVWIVGATHVMRVENGKTIATAPVTLDAHDGPPFRTVLGTSAGDVWLADGVLRHSQDGGVTWRVSHPCPHIAPSSFEADEIDGDARSLWTACGFGVRRSADSGATWVTAALDGLATETALHLSVGADDVWVAAQNGDFGLARSTDGGTTWTHEHLGAPTTAQQIWGVKSVGNGWAWARADGLWVRRGKAPWVRELAAGGRAFAIEGRSERDVWGAGPSGLVLRRRP